MSLRERLGISKLDGAGRHRRLFEQFGVLENPFPPASQPMGHPHKVMAVDERIEERLRTFLDDKSTQVVVVEGTQGVGKTNLLEYYQRELADIFGEDSRYYIIRYYADPEPDFSGVVRRIVQEFGVDGLKKVGTRFAEQMRFKGEKERILGVVRSYELRQGFVRLAEAAGNNDRLEVVSNLLLEYLTGLRIFKRHNEALGVQFRLDTTESRIQALHDLVYFSRELDCFKAIFLFLDELEKQGALPMQAATRYLSSIRALIDALPRNLFLVLAMTTEARSRYRTMLPALSDRLQATATLTPFTNENQAVELWKFYLDRLREAALSDIRTRGWNVGSRSVLDESQVRAVYSRLKKESENRGQGGVTPRAFLDALHAEAEHVFAQV